MTEREMTEGEKADFMAEMKKARGRVGLSVTSSCEWLLKFIRLEFDKLSEKDQVNLKREVAVFSTYTELNGEKSQLELIPIYDWSVLGAGDLSLPSSSEVKHLIEKTRTHVRALIEQGETVFHEILFPHVFVARSPSGLVRASARTLRAAWNFQYALLVLLQQQGHRIGRCPCCAQFFYRSRLDKEVCSDGCRSKYNVRRKRKTPPERFGMRGRPKSNVE